MDPHPPSKKHDGLGNRRVDFPGTIGGVFLEFDIPEI